MKQLIKLVMILFIAQNFNLYASNDQPIDEYSLNFLKTSSAPKVIKLLRNRRQNKSIKLQNGVLFTYNSRKAKNAEIAGNFSNWKPIRMNRGKNGVWYYFLPEVSKLNQIEYKFIIDSIWTSDPVNPLKKDDMSGSFVSLTKPASSSENKFVTYEIVEKKKKYFIIEFKLYNLNAYYISVIGDFNSWNPENDILRKGNDGIWRLQKRIPYGIYRYKYVIDGKWRPDTYNSKTASDPVGDICSVLEVQK